MNLKRKIASVGALVCAALAVAPAHAYTQCEGTMDRIWAGDGGHLWLHLKEGGAAIVKPDDPNKETVVAMSMTALVSSRRVIIRYQADNADCLVYGRWDFIGMYLL
ncbi:hypothetical protein [Novosphingobium sp.]|jgi:hypothetical protein|uniref:hypothetical protein n=1 Tax=Novosphingobium sp. TaxID=1874826 RepID=UPI002FE0EF06